MTIKRLSVDSCPYCVNHVPRNEQNFWSRWGKKYGQESDIIWRNGDFIIIAGLGALSEGYVILLPREHILSLGMLSEEGMPKFIQIKNEIRAVLCSLYGPITFFEHGMSSCGHAGGCVDHAHLHAFPCQNDFRPYLQQDLRETKVASLLDLREYAISDIPYLFYENPLQEKYVYTFDGHLPSQYFRRLWAQFVGRPDEWDWGVFLFEENIAKTIYKVRSAVQVYCDNTTFGLSLPTSDRELVEEKQRSEALQATVVHHHMEQ